MQGKPHRLAAQEVNVSLSRRRPASDAVTRTRLKTDPRWARSRSSARCGTAIAVSTLPLRLTPTAIRMMTAARRAGCAPLTSMKIPELVLESTFWATVSPAQGGGASLDDCSYHPRHSVMSPATAEAVELARGMKDREPRASKLSLGNAD